MNEPAERPTEPQPGTEEAGREAERRRRQRKRSVAIALLLVALVVIFYVVTLLQLQSNIEVSS